MKEIYKNPVFYYILIPSVVALWPLLVWCVYLPAVRESWTAGQEQYNKAQDLIKEILTIAPERLGFTESGENQAEFTYDRAVAQISALYGIPPVSYTYNADPVTVSSGRKSQSAKVWLKDVEITKFARFLSAIQHRWSSLQCTKVVLTKKKNQPDIWDVNLDFKYYY